MFYTDSISKSFLTGRGSWGPAEQYTPVDRWTAYEDPTYMGFYFRFLPNTVTSNTDYDYFPQGLFLGADGYHVGLPGTTNPAPETLEHPDSAVSYLQRRNEFYRADMMREFRDGMITMTTKSPWVFEKVTGLNEIWKFDPGVNYRAKDKKIVFDCTESINARMTYLIDLYRKASFDTAYMRYMLPDNQRYFSMELVVTEIRTMQYKQETFEPVTFLSFECDYCEFDFFGESPTYLDNLSRYAGEGARVKIPIKIGTIRERNRYGLLEAILSDTYGTFYRGKDWAKASFGPATSAKNTTDIPITTSQLGDILGRKKEVYSDGDVLTAQFNGLNPSKNLGNLGILGNLARGAIAALSSSLQTAINSRLLGNVYGFSLANLVGQLGGVLNNPIAAAQGIAANFASPEAIQAGVLGSVALSGAEIKLVEDLLGKAQTALESVAGTPLESASIADLVADQNEAIKNTQFSQNLEGDPGNTTFSSSNATLAGNPGSTPLDSNGAALSGNPGKTTFDSAGAVIEGNPGKTNLDSNGGDIKGSPEKEKLDSNGATLEGNSSKTAFESSGATLEGNSGKTTFASNGATLDGNPGKSNLDSNGAKIEGNPGKSKLDSNGAKIEGNPGKSKLDSNGAKIEGNPGTTELDPGSVKIEGNPGTTELDPGSVKIEGDPGKAKLDPENIKIEGDPGKAKLDPGNIKIEGKPGKTNLDPGSVKIEGNPGKAKLDPGSVKIEGNPGKANLDPGSVKIEGNPGKANLDSTKVKIEGKLEKQNLTQPSIMNSAMGKIIFGNNGTSLDGSLGKIVFSAASTTNKDPGKADIKTTKPNVSPLGTEKLESPIIAKIPLGKEIFSGVESGLIADKQEKVSFDPTPSNNDKLENIELSGAAITKSEVGKVDLGIAPNLVEKTDVLGSTDLATPISKEDKMSNINLTSSPVEGSAPGNVDLVQPDKIGEEAIGNTPLLPNYDKDDTNMGNASFTQPVPSSDNPDNMQVEFDAVPKPADLTQTNIGLEGVATGQDIAEGKGKPIDRKIIGGAQSNVNIGNNDTESTINK